MKKILKAVFLLLFCSLISSCSANRLLSSWNDPTFQNPSPGKILIIAISRDETKRRIFEDTFTDSLTHTNMKGIPSYTVSKPSTKPNLKELRATVKKTGVESVLITHIVGAKEQSFSQRTSRVVGTNSYPERIHTYGTDLYSYYPFIFRSVHAPGVYTETVKVILETNIYDVKSEKIIWTARSESTNPVMTRDYYQNLINLFVDDLKKKNLL